MKNCTDCANWNPDLPQDHYCDQNQNPGVIIWIGHVVFESNNSEMFVPDASECPCFVQNPWNGSAPYISPDEVCPDCKSHNVSFAFGYLYCADCAHQWEPEPDIPEEKECDLCLGSGFVNDDDCPECHGAGTLEPVA
jgi:hypothetical protein